MAGLTKMRRFRFLKAIGSYRRFNAEAVSNSPSGSTNDGHSHDSMHQSYFKTGSFCPSQVAVGFLASSDRRPSYSFEPHQSTLTSGWTLCHRAWRWWIDFGLCREGTTICSNVIRAVCAGRPGVVMCVTEVLSSLRLHPSGFGSGRSSGG